MIRLSLTEMPVHTGFTDESPELVVLQRQLGEALCHAGCFDEGLVVAERCAEFFERHQYDGDGGDTPYLQSLLTKTRALHGLGRSDEVSVQLSFMRDCAEGVQSPSERRRFREKFDELMDDIGVHL